MVPAQDVLELGSEARMNRPGELGGNWCWRLEPGQLDSDAGGTAACRSGGVGADVSLDQSKGSTGIFAATTLRPSRS